MASNQSRLSIRQKNDRQTCSSLIYDLRPRSTASLHTHCVCQAIASLTYALRTLRLRFALGIRRAHQAFAVLTYALRLPYELRSLCALLIVILDVYDSRPYEPVTSFQQPKEVTKKGRPPASHLSLRFSTNTGRENAFPTRLSLE
ncbi:hypothetical protein ACFSZP_02010 [Paraglaciecola agarilytica]